MDTVNAYVTSLIRTYVPAWVAVGLVWLGTHFGVVLDKDLSTGASVVAVGLVLVVYYAAARLLEERFPLVGRILLTLGLSKAAAPTYKVIPGSVEPLATYRRNL